MQPLGFCEDVGGVVVAGQAGAARTGGRADRTGGARYTNSTYGRIGEKFGFGKKTPLQNPKVCYNP